MEFTYQYTYDSKGRPQPRLFQDYPSCEMTIIPAEFFQVDKKGKKLKVFDTRKVIKTIIAITTREQRIPLEDELKKIPQWYSEYLSMEGLYEKSKRR